MNRIAIFVGCCLLLISISSSAQDDLVTKKIICYDGKSSIFPASWLDKKVNAKASAADTAFFRSDKEGVAAAFSKIPDEVLEKELKNVYIVGTLKFNRQSFTGTNSRTDIYIVGGNQQETEKTFHHEFSSILLRNYAGYDFQLHWKKISPELLGGNSAAAVKAGYNSVALNEGLMEKGYLTAYSLSNWENDFNMYAENIFSGGKQFWQLADKYPKAMEKVKLVIRFYEEKIWAGFTETYFRSLAGISAN